MLHVFVSAAGDNIRPGSTGKAIPGYQAEVLGAGRQPAADGDPGRLAVIGPTGCRYLADPRQADYVQDGWNITGDTYIRDADGYLWYQGRSDDIIVSAGYNIAPAEIERPSSSTRMWRSARSWAGLTRTGARSCTRRWCWRAGQPAPRRRSPNCRTS